ncbi:VWA domain-containing protein [Microbacterium resistens]|uniref:vWA domain-containing protein n=1 Tax=Microbacterium resistens TaxID=156977 RepID=UPI001C56C07F|nr:VWA domain-containing protein [Microbacterium resistens]MBW1639761.1 VWA domain-containing protein [Microbacterium resistens]
MILQPVIPAFLVVLLVVPMLIGTGWMLWRPATAPGAATAPAASARGGSRALWALRLVLVLACGLLLLRPGIPGGEVRTLATDTDIVVLVDTTASMVAEDGEDDEPRMTQVREDVRAIAAAYPGARFALITFDAAAQLRLPLTTDTSALVSAVDVLQPEVTRQSRGSSVGIAAPLLAETLRGAAKSDPERARMVFYLGDGEQTAATAPESFSASAKDVVGGAVLGYGTAEGGPMRETTGAFSGEGDYILYQGEPALSVIDETTLRTIAEELGVDYLPRAGAPALDLPPAPSTTTAYREGGTTGNVTDLSWILALVIALLLCVELARAAMLITRMRGLAVRGGTGGGGEPR